MKRSSRVLGKLFLKLNKAKGIVKWVKYVFIFYILINSLSWLIIVKGSASVASAESPVFKDSFSLQTYDSRFYITYLNASEILELNLSSKFEGRFDIFIYDERPMQTYVTLNGYDNRIFNVSVAYNTSTSLEKSLVYNASKDGFYYVQIVCIENGPDSYILQSNKELTLYFIPFVPGYSPVGLIISIFLSTIYLVQRLKGKFLKKLDRTPE
ncbi:MAG: hypothetical protein ACTSU2_10645 [Promethearchaeota archaeon]